VAAVLLVVVLPQPATPNSAAAAMAARTLNGFITTYLPEIFAIIACARRV
jgi:hypothetical protein